MIHLRIIDDMSTKKQSTITKRFDQANSGRDFSVYTWRMDAALEAKARSILPYFGDIQEGDVIVDAGSGTGALAELVAKTFQESRPMVIALDISHELQERAREDRCLTKLVLGDASRRHFPDNTIAVKYFSTVLHEIFSFGGRYPALKRTLETTYDELIPGGRIIIRDFARAPHGDPVYMRFVEDRDASLSGLSSSGSFDYDRLSPSALLERFQKEFGGGNVFTYSKTSILGKMYYVIDPEWAHEFYLRKDYTGNWRQEIREQYSYWTLHEARVALENAGFVNVKVIPDPNEYILKNRLRGKVELYWRLGSELRSVDFPPTHMIVYGEKPLSKRQRFHKTSYVFPAIVDYTGLAASVIVDVKQHTVVCGTRQFRVTRDEPLVGDKKRIYYVEGEQRCVLKVIRPDVYNLHNAFKSMFQIVERQHVLKAYGVNHMTILDYDHDGPPYRFVVQEAFPEEAICAADLIVNNTLTGSDIRQIAEVVNSFETQKEWQLDMNPFSWFRAPSSNSQATVMVYVAGKVYRYDERWRFWNIGLPQWTDSRYIQEASEFTAAIPKQKDVRRQQDLWRSHPEKLGLWLRYLDGAVVV